MLLIVKMVISMNEMRIHYELYAYRAVAMAGGLWHLGVTAGAYVPGRNPPLVLWPLASVAHVHHTCIITHFIIFNVADC